jgi:hypothetical protein
MMPVFINCAIIFITKKSSFSSKQIFINIDYDLLYLGALFAPVRFLHKKTRSGRENDETKQNH